MARIYLCYKCKEFTMEELCPKCANKTINPKPAKFSLKDRFGAYRRLLKNDMES